MGAIATGIRSYIALNDPKETLSFVDKDPPYGITFEDLGFNETDFDGKYFTKGHFDWIINYNPNTKELTYEVQGFAAGTTITYPQVVTLNEDGGWVEN